MLQVRFGKMGLFLAVPTLLALVLSSPLNSQTRKGKAEWLHPDDPRLPLDFKLQGEYEGDKIGCQVIALGEGRFQAVLFPGGLPGSGWDGKHKSLLDGKLEDNVVTFEPATGKRRYKARKPEVFSATSQFPPPGHKSYAGTLRDSKLTIKSEDGNALILKKVVRKSPTMGAKPPKDAIILFDGKNTDEWIGGRVDEKTGWLSTDRHDVRTKRKFSNYKIHVEFLTPFLPFERDQGRGNSGFYQVDHYEVQILDSFGLEGKNNECGGIYGKSDSKLNACFPPLTWQTYDVDFTNAVRDDSGKKIKNARITVKLNGITIHDDFEIDGKTGGARPEPEGTPGPLMFQGHGNVLHFRNVWIVEKK